MENSRVIDLQGQAINEADPDLGMIGTNLLDLLEHLNLAVSRTIPPVMAPLHEPPMRSPPPSPVEINDPFFNPIVRNQNFEVRTERFQSRYMRHFENQFQPHNHDEDARQGRPRREPQVQPRLENRFNRRFPRQLGLRLDYRLDRELRYRIENGLENVVDNRTDPGFQRRFEEETRYRERMLDIGAPTLEDIVEMRDNATRRQNETVIARNLRGINSIFQDAGSEFERDRTDYNFPGIFSVANIPETNTIEVERENDPPPSERSSTSLDQAIDSMPLFSEDDWNNPYFTAEHWLMDLQDSNPITDSSHNESSGDETQLTDDVSLAGADPASPQDKAPSTASLSDNNSVNPKYDEEPPKWLPRIKLILREPEPSSSPSTEVNTSPEEEPKNREKLSLRLQLKPRSQIRVTKDTGKTSKPRRQKRKLPKIIIKAPVEFIRKYGKKAKAKAKNTFPKLPLLKFKVPKSYIKSREATVNKDNEFALTSVSTYSSTSTDNSLGSSSFVTISEGSASSSCFASQQPNLNTSDHSPSTSDACESGIEREESSEPRSSTLADPDYVARPRLDISLMRPQYHPRRLRSHTRLQSQSQ